DGQQVIERTLKILQEAQSIRDLATELRDEGKGSLSIGTTHTQARYVLPDVIRQFRERYPQVRLNLHQGTSEQIAEMVAGDRIDCAIATGSEALFAELTLLPCYRWYRTVIVPRGHALANGARLSLKALAAAHCCASTCTTSRTCSRPTSTGASSSAPTVPPPPMRSQSSSPTSRCRCARQWPRRALRRGRSGREAFFSRAGTRNVACEGLLRVSRPGRRRHSDRAPGGPRRGPRSARARSHRSRSARAGTPGPDGPRRRPPAARRGIPVARAAA